MRYTYETAKNNRSIDSRRTFVDALDGQSVLNLDSFESVFNKAEELVKSEYPKVTGGALSNVRGNWYEWLITIGMIEFHRNNDNAHYLLPLPNISSYDCAKLYKDRIYAYIRDLRAKVASIADVSLITSNPDFVIIDKDVDFELCMPENGLITVNFIDNICQAFLQMEHKCSLDQIKGYVAVKSSLRPDRRLQIAHEGSLMKALYKHVQTREWIIDAPGIKYYAISSEVKEADRNALRTVATHSIVDVGSVPRAAVDGLLCVFSGAELEVALNKILIED